jgi:hypothetical protein
MNSSGAQIERLKCRATNCTRNGTGDCICVYGTVGVTGPVTVQGTVDITTLSNSDAFGRLRVSNPYTLFEFNSITGKNTALFDEAVTSGTVTHNAQAYTELAVTAASGSVVRQTYEYIPYQPGKSKLIFLTGVLNPDNIAAGFTSRIGTFDDYNGIYIEATTNTLAGLTVGIRRYDGSSVIEDRVSYSAPWNGALPSGFDVTKAQIFFFDLEWLGVGQVRCGVVQGGKYYVYHTFTHINILTAPYMQLAKLPVRYEIRSTTAPSATMRQICGTVISEGGISPIGRIYNYNNYEISGGMTVDVNTLCSVWIPVFGIRLKSPAPLLPFTRRGTIKIKALDIYNTVANSTGAWKLLLNPTITPVATSAAGWQPYSSYTSSSRASESLTEYIQYDSPPSAVSINQVSDGIILYAGCYATRSAVDINQTTDELIAAWGANANIAGTPDEIILAVNVVAVTGANPKIFASIQWIELI